jgi:flagellar M-ring protein FliF
MDSPTTQIAPTHAAARGVALPEAGPASFGRLTALPVRSKLTLGIGAAALVAVLAALLLWNQQGDYKVLYANLSDKDGGAIIAQLSQMNVPYRHAEGGSAILIPADKVRDVRFKLAQTGLPKGGTAGFELMDSARFGQTQFQERVTFQRGLEGELVRSISSLAAVQAARVHLALPQQNGFFREQQKPSASVVLTLAAGRTLDRSQIAGIVHLVSSSVPELSPKAVSVVDQSGSLLSGASADNQNQGLDAQQLQYVQQVEAGYLKRVHDLLEPLVGRDNLRATVTAEVDFTQSESTAEAYKPNQGGAAAAVRSLTSTESSNSASAQPAGVPGAASNQPPTPAAAPLTGASAPLHAAQVGAGGGGSQRSNAVNYEVDKTVRVTRNATGTVKRLNAAVVVNHRVSTDARGKTISTPLSSDEIDKITALVQEGIGFSKERGDSVKVVNAPFRVEPAPKVEAPPLWKQPDVIDIVRAAAVPAALGLVALLIVFSVIRPALRAVHEPATGARGRLDAVVGDVPALRGGTQTLALEAPKIDQQLVEARTLAKQNPQAVAAIVRGWVNGEAA